MTIDWLLNQWLLWHNGMRVFFAIEHLDRKASLEGQHFLKFDDAADVKGGNLSANGTRIDLHCIIHTLYLTFPLDSLE